MTMEMRPSRTARRLGAVLALLAGLGCAAPRQAWATWSIVAVDEHTGEVGSAGASCTPFVAGIVGLAPGRGVMVAQAASNPFARRRGVQLLQAGASPELVIAAVTNPEFDDSVREQQYGVVALGHGGASAAFTGASTHGWRGHLTAEGVAVQGNVLTDGTVVSAALAAFRASGPRPLAERLLLALEAGGEAGGDRRCGEQDALSSYLVVARRGDTREHPYLRLVVPGQEPGGPNAVHLLRQRFERWRQGVRDS